MTIEEKNELWFAKQFDEFDRNGDRTIDQKELNRLFDKLGVSKDSVKKFKPVSRTHFSYEETKILYSQLTVSDWIKEIFNEMATESGDIDLETFHKFVSETQGKLKCINSNFFYLIVYLRRKLVKRRVSRDH